MDLEGIQSTLSKVEAIKQFKVVQADADSWCYDCANTEESLEHNIEELNKYIQYMFNRCNTEKMYLHVTFSKGGRIEMATLKGYQTNRNTDEELSNRVKALRKHMVEAYIEGDIIGKGWYDREADDGIAYYQTIMKGSAIISIDKDLQSVDGYHIDPKTFMSKRVSKFGRTYTRYTESGNEKFAGEGNIWFWHQMLIGDTADNIKGLPYLTGELANRYVPTKKYNPNRKPLACGEKKAIAVLSDVKDEKTALHRVAECYYDYFGNYEQFFEQAFLLWMRRSDDILDVLNYFKSLNFGYTLTKRQQEAINIYKESLNAEE